MELGGNIPETLIQHLMLSGSHVETQEPDIGTESLEAHQSDSLDEPVEKKEEDEEEEEPLKAVGR